MLNFIRVQLSFISSQITLFFSNTANENTNISSVQYKLFFSRVNVTDLNIT